MSERTCTSHMTLINWFCPSLYACTGNSLSELPSVIGSLSSLRTLDVSDNNIVQLPKTLAHIRTLEVCVLRNQLEHRNAKHWYMAVYKPVCVCVFLCVCAVWQSFTLDAATMTYPPVSVCTEGTESIQRFLCSGEVYSIIKLAFGLLQKKIFESNTSLWVSMTTSVVSLRHLLATAHINTRNSFIIICGGFNVFYVIVKWEYLLSLW